MVRVATIIKLVNSGLCAVKQINVKVMRENVKITRLSFLHEYDQQPNLKRIYSNFFVFSQSQERVQYFWKCFMAP